VDSTINLTCILYWADYINMKKILIVYNTSHYVYMFRLSLISSLLSEGYEVYVLSPKDSYSKKLESFGVIHVDLKLTSNSISPVKDVHCLFDMYKKIKKISPDVILNYTIKPNIYSSLVAKQLRISYINNITGLGSSFISDGIVNKITHLLYRLSLSKAKVVFFQNQYDLEIFLNKNLVTKNQVRLLPGSGVDIDKFTPRDKTIETSKFRFLLIARIIKDKGIVEYVEAAENFRNKHPDFNVEFCLLGEIGVANRTAIPRASVDKWIENDIINYLGVDDDIRDHIANADCIVLPSYREGTSKTLLESAAMGKPLIASNVPGCNNVIEDGKNGYLCKVKDSQDLYNKMLKLYHLSSSEIDEFSSFSRLKATEEFDEKIVIENYLRAVNSCV